MELRLIKYFMEVAKTLSFTEAAQALYISQPALSRQIMELEQELGVELFIRKNRTVQLTKAGEALYQESISLMNHLDSMIQKTKDVDAGFSGSFTLGTMGISNADLYNKFKNFQKMYPDIHIQTEVFSCSELIRSLRNDTVQIGYMDQHDAAREESLEFLHVTDLEYYFAVSKEHPFSKLEEIDFKHVSQENFIIHDDGSTGYKYILDVCRKHGFKPKITRLLLQPMLVETLLVQIELGVGVSFVPYTPEFTNRPNLSLIKIRDEQMTLPMGLVWKRDIENPSVRLFIDYYKNSL